MILYIEPSQYDLKKAREIVMGHFLSWPNQIELIFGPGFITAIIDDHKPVYFNDFIDYASDVERITIKPLFGHFFELIPYVADLLNGYFSLQISMKNKKSLELAFEFNDSTEIINIPVSHCFPQTIHFDKSDSDEYIVGESYKFSIVGDSNSSDDSQSHEENPIPNFDKLSTNDNAIKLPNIHDNPTISDNDICQICMENKLSTINLPCAHICFCIKCAHEYITTYNKQVCPICNIKLDEIKRFFK